MKITQISHLSNFSAFIIEPIRTFDNSNTYRNCHFMNLLYKVHVFGH